jgi:hypothetical protein
VKSSRYNPHIVTPNTVMLHIPVPLLFCPVFPRSYTDRVSYCDIFMIYEVVMGIVHSSCASNRGLRCGTSPHILYVRLVVVGLACASGL